MSESKKFSGKLTEPLTPLPDPLVIGLRRHVGDENIEREIEEAREARIAEELDKLGLLLDHYEIPRDSAAPFGFLSLTLARIVCEGFKEPPSKKRRGRLPKWSLGEKFELEAAVDQLIREKNKSSYSVRWACRQLAKESKWSDKVEAKDPKLVMKSPIGDALRDVYKSHKKESNALTSKPNPV